MATRLSDTEFAERARAGNRQRADRRRARMARSGYQQLLVWMPGDLRNEIDRIAADRGTSVADAATMIVRAGIAALKPALSSVDATPAPVPVSIEPAHAAPGTTAERDTAICELQRQGLSHREIARQLAERGIVTATGNPLSKDTIAKAIKRAGLQAD